MQMQARKRSKHELNVKLIQFYAQKIYDTSYFN